MGHGDRSIPTLGAVDDERPPRRGREGRQIADATPQCDRRAPDPPLPGWGLLEPLTVESSDVAKSLNQARDPRLLKFSFAPGMHPRSRARVPVELRLHWVGTVDIAVRGATARRTSQIYHFDTPPRENGRPHETRPQP